MKLTPLYEVKLIIDGKQHFYTMGDDPTWHTGVTGALGMINKPALIPWAVKACSDNIQEEFLKYPDTIFSKELIQKICLEGKSIYKKKALDAADIGTRVHQWCNNLIQFGENSWKTDKAALTDDISVGVQAFTDWKAQEGIQIELGDTKIGSRIFGYGGSLDFVSFDKNNEPVIWDIKTTKKRKDTDHGIYPEYAYQLAAYAQAFHETYGFQVKNVYALWLNKEKPEFKAVKISNLAEAFQGFLAALKLYKLNKYQLFE